MTQIQSSEAQILSVQIAEVHKDVLETKAQTTKTNGRVTELERRAIREDAAQAEREKVALELARSNEARSRRRSWVPGSTTAVVCVFLGAAAQRFLL